MTEQYQQIKDICLRLLARREHSQKELQDKLVLRGFDRISSQEVIAELAEQGWQSDDRYAESYARQRIEKGCGPVRIAHELKLRGGGDADLDAIVTELAGSWMEALQRVYLGKYANDKRMPAKEWLKRSRFLQQRGFSGDMIKALFVQLDISLER
ncbi:regulatory protein RecX [Methylomarinum sp. Ch1-1]|uniref:Regulatory protein RecX n=1 Tax=Methylomarinum roseum TaxID=3067653 RepID=A0AAU7NYL8_9GAMM|nr:regulatory protein RecX [Methylomarinum sp. Ch1-1]MDP4521815.1 regulatory protein RecX [Methylomarinum sp. Ch1-1]